MRFILWWKRSFSKVERRFSLHFKLLSRNSSGSFSGRHKPIIWGSWAL